MTKRHKYIFIILNIAVLILYFLFLIFDYHLFKEDNGFTSFALILILSPIVFSTVFLVLMWILKTKSLFALLSAASLVVILTIHVVANLAVGVNIFRIDWILTDVTWLSSYALLGYAICLIAKFKGK